MLIGAASAVSRTDVSPCLVARLYSAVERHAVHCPGVHWLATELMTEASTLASSRISFDKPIVCLQKPLNSSIPNRALQMENRVRLMALPEAYPTGCRALGRRSLLG